MAERLPLPPVEGGVGKADAADTAARIRVEVAFALPTRQRIVALEVAVGCTVYEAVMRSGIVDQFPGQIRLDEMPMGIFSEAVPEPKTRVIRAGERVEIYRPLVADPKEQRRKRVAAVKAQKQTQAEQLVAAGSVQDTGDIAAGD